MTQRKKRGTRKPSALAQQLSGPAMELFRLNMQQQLERLGWHQKDLAEKAGVSASMISRSADNMTLWGAVAISKAFGVSLAKLVSDNSSEGAPPADLAAHAKKRQLERSAGRLYLAESVVQLLTDDGMRIAAEDGIVRKPELPERVVSAAWAVVHVKHVPFETAIAVAREVYEALPSDERETSVTTAKWFLDKIFERLGNHPDKGSGTYPSVVRRAASSRPPARGRK